MPNRGRSNSWMLKMKFMRQVCRKNHEFWLKWHFARFQIKSIRALLGRDDYQNEDCSYKYTAKRRQAFLKSLYLCRSSFPMLMNGHVIFLSELLEIEIWFFRWRYWAKLKFHEASSTSCRILRNDHWLHHTMNAEKPNFNSYIYVWFLDYLLIVSVRFAQYVEK